MKDGSKKLPARVGYGSPPLHARFKPGQSGNPGGRRKGSKNLKTLFCQILNEEVSLREGAELRKVTKGEAILRGLVVGAIKGEQETFSLCSSSRSKQGSSRTSPKLSLKSSVLFSSGGRLATPTMPRASRKANRDGQLLPRPDMSRITWFRGRVRS